MQSMMTLDSRKEGELNEQELSEETARKQAKRLIADVRKGGRQSEKADRPWPQPNYINEQE